MARSDVVQTTILMVIVFLTAIPSVAQPIDAKSPPCRFSHSFSQEDVLRDSNAFAWDLLYWEGNFHQDNIGYNAANGMTYDGTLLDPHTGLNNLSGLHPFSAASKESLHFMALAHAIAGNPLAARFLSPEKPQAAADIAYNILDKKLQTYIKFNQTYPGFAGFLPWFLSNETSLRPAADWVNRVPALDNGELIWAVYAVVEALDNCRGAKFKRLATSWQKWLDYTKRTAAQVFYNGTGRVCAVTSIKNQSWSVSDPNQAYTCEGNQTLNDPYEGELFTWWLYFFSPQLSKDEKDSLWTVKRPQLVSVDWRSNSSLSDVTVQKGYWFSSHEQWKLLEMPYLDIDIAQRIFRNAERVRTCNSFLNRDPGMYASVNNVTDEGGQILGYISNAGISSVSFISVQELDVVTPYAVFPVILFNQSVGLAWWKNMVDGQGMQNPYGSTESERVDGTGISSFVSWDSKITTVVALFGGVIEFVRGKMLRDGIYDDFAKLVQAEYEMVFEGLHGEDVQFCLPTVGIPITGEVHDYQTCK